METAVAKALRSEATDILEVRMVLSGPSWSVQGSYKNKGMFEVRRRDSVASLSRNKFTREDWNERMLYIENTPVQYASLSGVFHLIQALLAKNTDTVPTSNRIQAISFPPHHLDKPRDIPKCKGFALVTLLDVEDVQRLLREWPWTSAVDVKPPIPEIQEAVKFGFRTLSKRRWDEMKDEYLAYRARLVKEIVAYEDEITVIKRRRSPSPAISSIPPQTVESTLSSSSLFPPNCLVFVRNLHCETNKTTLRALFSKAFTTLPDGIDYVDFTKGMDSCYLRVATSEHVRALTDYFTQAKMAQTNGLDSEGRDVEAKAITMETVGGRREEIYWEKVPAKVRREAVDKALRLLESDTMRKDSGGNKRIRRKK